MSYEKFKNLTDEQIIDLAAEDKTGIDYLLEKYKYIVRRKASSLYLIGADKEDLIQEGMIGLYKSIRDFDSKKDSSFRKFAELCVARQMYTAVTISNRKKNIPLNTYVSFYTPANNKDDLEYDDKTELLDFMFSNEESNPEELFIDKENASMIEYRLNEMLSKMEQEVLQLYIDGLGYTEIASEIGKSPKSIDNALQRIRTKLNKVLREL